MGEELEAALMRAGQQIEQLQRQCEVLRTELAAAVAAERERCAAVCFEAGATGASFAEAERRILQADYQPGRPWA